MIGQAYSMEAEVKRSMFLLGVVMAVLLAACGDDDAATTTTVPGTTSEPPPATSTTTPEGSTTSEAPPTTTIPPATTTSEPPPTTTPPPLFTTDGDFFPDVLPGSEGPNGSGCITGETTLGDGVWFGYVEGISGGTLTFDLACFFTGAAAVTAATEDGYEAFDYYIRNKNPKTYSVDLAPGAMAYYVNGSTIELVAVGAGAWPNAASFLACPGEWCSVWLYVNQGKVTELVEQYVP